MTFDAFSFTSAGGKAKNEDSVWYAHSDSNLLAILADGLGSHGGGEIASAAAVEVIRTNLPETGFTENDALALAFEGANAAVTAKQTAGVKMKSTAVVLAIENERVNIAHVGDSRGYMFRKGALAFQTRDHSVSQMAVLQGFITPAQIRFHKDRNQLMRALGTSERSGVEFGALPKIAAGDAFLLCSDGFWEYVVEDEMIIERLKSRTAKEWVYAMLARVSSRVKEGHDNLSAFAVIVS